MNSLKNVFSYIFKVALKQKYPNCLYSHLYVDRLVMPQWQITKHPSGLTQQKFMSHPGSTVSPGNCKGNYFPTDDCNPG